MYSSMNEIVSGLWLGDFEAAKDTFKLKKSGITHILTVAGGLTPTNY